MRKSSLRKILKVMSSDNRARVFEANSRACHPRIAISINEIDLPAEEHVTEIRTPCDENQCTDENDFRQEREAPPHAPFKSAIRFPQSEIFIESIRDWSRGVCYVLQGRLCISISRRKVSLRIAVVYAVRDELPAELREILTLRHQADLSYKEVGDITQIPLGTVMSRLARASLQAHGTFGSSRR